MSLLRDRRFALLLAGQAVNGIGSWCALVALWGYAAYRFDASPIQIAFLSLSWALPTALLGPVGGVPVDRFGPRRVLIIADMVAAAVAVGMAMSHSYGELLALGILLGLARVCSEPAFAALAPRLVEDHDLLRANALLGAVLQSSIAFGPLLAAGSISLWGPRGAFLIDAVTYVIGVAVVVPLRLRPIVQTTSRAARSVPRELGEGLRVVRDRPAIRDLLTLGCSVYLVWGAYAVIEPIYVRDVLHRPAQTFALLQAAFGIVLLVNGLLLPRFGDRIVRMRTIRIAALGTALCAPLYVGTSRVAVAFFGIALWGAFTAWFLAPQRTLIQRATPIQAHGRVLALDSALRSWAHVIALPTAALLVGAFGVRATAFTFAAIPLIGALTIRRPTPAPDALPDHQMGGLVTPDGLGVSVEVGPRAQQAPREDAGAVAIVPLDREAPPADELGALRA